MNRKGLLYLSVILLVGIVSLWGCPKKAEVTTTPETQTEEATPSVTPAPSTEATITETKPEMKTEGPNEKSGVTEEGLKPIYFDFDKSFIRDDAKATMQANAEWLKANPKTNVRIEGNCDERGTVEYNQTLGQRRAMSAKKYLSNMGISANRISLISFGKEKPLCSQHEESCWQKNRRDDFIIVGE